MDEDEYFGPLKEVLGMKKDTGVSSNRENEAQKETAIEDSFVS